MLSVIAEVIRWPYETKYCATEMSEHIVGQAG